MNIEFGYNFKMYIVIKNVKSIIFFSKMLFCNEFKLCIRKIFPKPLKNHYSFVCVARYDMRVNLNICIADYFNLKIKKKKNT